MDASKQYSDFAVKISKTSVEKYMLKYFELLHKDLQRADIRKPLIEYLSIAVTTSALVFLFQTSSISIIMTNISMLGIPAITRGLSLVIGFLGGLFSAIAVFGLFYIYPSLKLAERRKNIDDSIPFATLYFATVAGSGAPPVTMFRTLAKFKEYGEISNEAERVVQEIDVMGVNFADALEHSAKRTPSEKFVDLLWGMKTVLTTGGDLRKFLHEKSDSLIRDYKQRLRDYANQLSLLTEIYTVVVVVGPVLFTIMLTIMGMMSGGIGTQRLIVAIQLTVIFLGLPAASFAFLVISKGMSPKS